jgi:hypothetical protein
VEVLKGVVRNIEIMFWHDPKRPDRGQCPAVFAVKLVHSATFNDQFPLITARQVEVAHQAITWVAFIAVARVVHARPIVAGITRVVFARITPSGIGHGTLRCMLSWVVGEDALAVAARGGSGSAEAPGRIAAAFGAWSYGNPGSGRLGPGRWIQPAW